MNQDTFQGHWKELKGKVKQQWGKLTDDDLTQINGSVDVLEGKLQKTYGYQKDKAKKEIDNFLNENDFDDKEDF